MYFRCTEFSAHPFLNSSMYLLHEEEASEEQSSVVLLYVVWGFRS